MGDKNIRVSIICCSYKRPESLRRLKESLDKQTFRDFEFILCDEEGNLVELKDKGWRKSKGDILVWVDDDIECSPGWLSEIVNILDNNSLIAGVTGPTFIDKNHIHNRDVFRNDFIGQFYNWFFLENKKFYPGLISRCGAPTMGANFVTPIVYKAQVVDFLEPPHFALRRWCVEAVDGFDLGYKGVGEWCDVDLIYRIRNMNQIFGKSIIMLFSPRASVRHFPVKDETTSKRKETKTRYENYCKWSDRYIEKTPKHFMYRLFLKIYFFVLSRR